MHANWVSRFVDEWSVIPNITAVTVPLSLLVLSALMNECLSKLAYCNELSSIFVFNYSLFIVYL